MFNEFLQNYLFGVFFVVVCFFGFFLFVFLNTYRNESMKNNFPNLVTVHGKIIISQCTSINALLAFM